MSRARKPKFDERILLAIRNGEPLKSAAADCGISVGYAYRIAHNLGYISELVSADERKALRQLRAKTLSPVST